MRSRPPLNVSDPGAHDQDRRRRDSRMAACRSNDTTSWRGQLRTSENARTSSALSLKPWWPLSNDGASGNAGNRFMTRAIHGPSSALVLVLAVLTGCVSRPTLETFQIDDAPCYDRSVQSQTSVVDTHVHFRPFGGPAVPFEEVTRYLEETGVRFANIYGIGQTLPATSPCTYYLDCPGTLVTPTLRNDFVNAANYGHVVAP